MLLKKKFHPEHINATHEDLEGNNGIGRYILLPGSDGRAQEISQLFDNVTVKTHARAHNLYLGTLQHEGKTIDVATISTGMGCPSTEIIVHELYHLGGKRFLRVGTAGSLQPARIKIGDIVNAQAAVRDENTATNYAPLELPAIAALDFVNVINLAASRLDLADRMHHGIVHCKSALYAREFGSGPRHEENLHYLDLLTNIGVMASEMETAALFILAQIYNQELRVKGKGPTHKVLAGAILAIVSTKPVFEHSAKVDLVIRNAMLLAIETIKILAIQEISG